jgi:hypothetical protein
MCPGRLRCDTINLNEPATVQSLIQGLIDLALDDTNIHRLDVRGTYHFTIPNGPITSEQDGT